MCINSVGSRVLPDFQLKDKVSKKEVVDTISEISTTGKITKEQFKKLAGNIEGGKDALGTILKDVVPADDIAKLKEFTLKKDGKTVNTTIDPAKTAVLSDILEKVIGKLPAAGEDTSYAMLDRLKNDLKQEHIGHDGDSVNKTASASFTVSGSIGLSSEASEGSASQWALGLTNTELGVSGDVHLTGSLGVTAENDNGKIKLSFEGKFGGGVGGSGGIQAAGVAGVSVEGSADISIRKKVTYTFDNIADAQKFLDDKGKGFVQEGTALPVGTDAKTFKRETAGAEVVRETSATLQSGIVPTVRTTKSPFFDKMNKMTNGLITGKTSLSNQSLSLKTESTSEGSTKTYALDTSSGAIFVSKKKTSTQLSISTDKDGKVTGGLFNVDVDLNKIRKNAGDKDALINKLTDRFSKIASKAEGADVSVDKTKIKEYISGTIDKLLKNDENYFTKEGVTTTPTGKGGILSKKYQATAVDINVSAPVAPGASVNAEVHAKWGSMVRLRIPLELDPANAAKLKVADANSVVQLYSVTAGGVGGGASIGQSGVLQGGVSGLVGLEVARATRLTTAVATPAITTP